MLISCPNCKSTFAVPAKAIGATGRKLKCSKCAHMWMQPPLQVDKSSLDNLLKVEYKESNNLPATIKKKKLKVAYVITFVFLLLSAGVVEVFKDFEKYPAIASKLHLDNYEGLRFHNFQVKSEINDNKLNFLLSGTVVNISDKKIKLPGMNIKVLSPGGRIMTQSKLKMEQEYIDPFQSIDINPTITKVSGNADKLEISFENWLESIIR